MSYIIATDSSSNIPREIVKKLEIPVLPFHYTMDGEEYRETLLEEEVQRRAFFAAMRINVEVKTSLINFNEFEEFFEPFLKEGKDLLYIGMSSGISSTFNNAEMAAEELREAYPDRKIELVDTKNASLGEGLPVLRAYAMRDEGKDIETVAEALRDLVPRMRGSFMVDDIMYLKHTGRVSGVVAVAGKALGIRPLLRGDDDGHIVQAGKSRGKKAALNALLDDFNAHVLPDSHQQVAVAHCDDEESAQYMAEKMLENPAVDDVIIEWYESVTGSHLGPGSVAIFYEADHR
ncbi:MAG: DegV family protein [Oscillospiraceae bacterium]|nr:DegV family protein [Oscillospiraceae bacterium]MBQ5659792.1 DegV family protein [Lachnospiraceae bacterium]